MYGGTLLGGGKYPSLILLTPAEHRVSDLRLDAGLGIRILERIDRSPSPATVPSQPFPRAFLGFLRILFPYIIFFCGNTVLNINTFFVLQIMSAVHSWYLIKR